MIAPRLAIVVTGRNDNYGGDFNDRFLTTLRFNHRCLTERQVPYEVILVEWNPIAGRPYLAQVVADACPWLRNEAGYRPYVVAGEYHRALTQNPQIAYLEYVAKNVGVRRAAAPWVLTTNTDVLLGRHVVDTIAADRLDRDVLYRAARFDIKLAADQSSLTWALLEDSANHVRAPKLKPPIYGGGTGDFVLATQQTFAALRGYNEVYRAARSGVDVNLLVKAHGCGHRIADIGGPVYHINHVGSFRISKAAYQDAAETPWGNMRWHARGVAYVNGEGWGLGTAPERTAGGITFLDFDWSAVPPLVELRRVVLPMRTELSED